MPDGGPIRGPRDPYQIDDLTVRRWNPATETLESVPVVVLMKKPVGDKLGLESLDTGSDDLVGVFQGEEDNAGFKYQKRVGGFKGESWGFRAKTKFELDELIPNADGVDEPSPRQVKTIYIGFPRGLRVHEVLRWAGANEYLGQNAAKLITPRGNSYKITASAP